MIDHDAHKIYVDFSTLATFRACHEKCRLEYRDGWRTARTDPKLTFGHAFHAAIAEFYDQFGEEIVTQEARAAAVVMAKAAFLRDLQIEGAELPITLEQEERRSLERGLALIDAYIHRWQADHYVNILGSNGKPLTEMGFQYPLTQFEGWDVVYVGYIDRVMRSIMSGRPVIFETKTTTMGLDPFIAMCKPNHQVTGYFPPVWNLQLEVRECVWDTIFISNRMPDIGKAVKNRFWMYGIDIDKDLKRSSTTRSMTDVTEFLIDIEEDALEYCRWLTSGKTRWSRNAPGACHTYGGCQFRKRCSLNLDSVDESAYMTSQDFAVSRWEPWKKIIAKDTA